MDYNEFRANKDAAIFGCGIIKAGTITPIRDAVTDYDGLSCEKQEEYDAYAKIWAEGQMTLVGFAAGMERLAQCFGGPPEKEALAVWYEAMKPDFSDKIFAKVVEKIIREYKFHRFPRAAYFYEIKGGIAEYRYFDESAYPKIKNYEEA